MGSGGVYTAWTCYPGVLGDNLLFATYIAKYSHKSAVHLYRHADASVVIIGNCQPFHKPYLTAWHQTYFYYNS